MVFTPDILTDNSTMSPGPSVTFKNTSARKSLHLFTEVLVFKKKTAVLRVDAAESKRKTIRAYRVLW